MTNEEAIKILKEIIDVGWLISDIDKCTAIDACEMAIKALEQQPVLDKIRAEITEYKDDKVIHAERNEMIDIVLEIIDKYRAEGEQVGNPDRLEGEDKE